MARSLSQDSDEVEGRKGNEECISIVFDWQLVVSSGSVAVMPVLFECSWDGVIWTGQLDKDIDWSVATGLKYPRDVYGHGIQLGVEVGLLLLIKTVRKLVRQGSWFLLLSRIV